MTMNKLKVVAILIISFSLNNCFAQNSVSNKELQLVASIQLPTVSGRIDHLAFDTKNQTIFIAALGNNTVEVVDLKSKKVIFTIKGLHEPQGIKYLPENNTVFVANGENGECDIYNADTYQLITTIKMPGGDADNVRYDVTSGKIFVGYGEGGVAIIDAKTFKQLADVKLPGHPESFQLSADSKKIFVNVPDALILATIDLEKNTITDKWKIEIAKANFPMALDATNHRLFIGCRNPAKLLVIDSETGKIVAQIDIDSDTDDVFYNSPSKQIYVSCGDGYVDVIKQNGPDKYEVTSRIESRSGARTSLYVPELNQLLVAAPARSGNEAQLMIFEKK
jgi:DNA-binding beta-propeller fold protein YncE